MLGWERDGAAPAPRQALGAASVPSKSGAPVYKEVM